MPMPKPPTSASEISVQTPEENNHEGKHDTEQDDENKNLMNTNKNLPPVMICEKKKKKKILKDFQNQGIIFCVVMLLIAFVAVAVKYGMDINKLKTRKPIMLYQPTEEYLKSTDRSTTIKWRLLEEHSQKPFLQHNASHLKVNRDGFFLISCSLLMESRVNKTNVLNLLVYYGNKKTVYTKQTLPIGYGRFPFQLTVNLRLKQGDYISVEVIPSNYIFNSSGGNYLSIVLNEFIDI